MLEYLALIFWPEIRPAAEPYVRDFLYKYSIHSWWDVLKWIGVFILCAIGMGAFEFLKVMTINNQEGIFGGNDGDDGPFAEKRKPKPPRRNPAANDD